jgi:hypothetical protein
MNRVHQVRLNRVGGRIQTLCGLVGWPCPGTATEFDTYAGTRFEALPKGDRGVTCRNCLRVREREGGK